MIAMKTISSVKADMRSLRLSPHRGKHIYAALLNTKQIPTPRSLRGYRRDPVSGFKWKREFEFRVRHLYGIRMGDLLSVLADRRGMGMVTSSRDGSSSYFVAYVGSLLVEVYVDMDEKVILSCSLVNFA